MSSSDRIPLEGVLNCWNDEHDLPDLLLFVCRMKKTGKLVFSNPEGDKTLHVRGGRIVFAESSSGDDGLGHFLLRTGKISLMDYLRVSKLVEPGKRLGALLVAEGVMEPKDLAPAVLGQVRAIILGLFRRTETWYRFKEEPLSTEIITLDLPVESLILDGVRQVESWRRISKGVGQLDSQYRTVDTRREEWQGAAFPPVVEELFDMLGSPTSVAHICTEATLPDFEACRYIWAFRCLGWVERAGQTGQAEPVAEAAPEPAPAPPEETSAVNADAAADAVAAAAKTTASPEASEAAREAVRRPTLGPPPEPKPEEPKPESKFRRPTIIPQQLIETRIAFDPPVQNLTKKSTGTTQRVHPAPVIPDFSEDDEPAAAAADAAHAGPSESTEASPAAGSRPAPPLAPPPPPPPRPVPDALAHTNLAVEPPSAKAPTPPGPSEEAPVPASAPAPAPPPPRPIPEGLAHTNLAVEPPSAKTPPPPAQPAAAPPPPRPVPENLAHTNLAVELPTAKASPPTHDAAEPEPSAPSLADFAQSGDEHTQIFTRPTSTSEMMEAILNDNDGSSPDLSPPSVGATAAPAPEANRDASTRYFDSPTALADEKPHAEPPPLPTPQKSPEPETPAGFEGLAFENSDPSVSSIEQLSMPARPDGAPQFEEDDAMASFHDVELAYAAPAEPQAEPQPEVEAEAEAEVGPVVEATVVSESPVPVVEADADAEPPPTEQAVLAPPPPPPRKRHPDEGFELDDFAHLITRNE